MSILRYGLDCLDNFPVIAKLCFCKKDDKSVDIVNTRKIVHIKKAFYKIENSQCSLRLFGNLKLVLFDNFTVIYIRKCK